MNDVFLNILASRHPLSGLFYGVLGAALGAAIGMAFSISAKLPKLMIDQGSSGSGRDGLRIHLRVANQPSFFGKRLEGDTAKDLFAWVQLKVDNSTPHPIFWCERHEGDDRISLEPGKSQELLLFATSPGDKGYCIVDRSGKPVARFQDPKLEFSVWINDRFSRRTARSFTVLFDDTNLQSAPRLRVKFPTTFAMRLGLIENGLRDLWTALVIK